MATCGGCFAWLFQVVCPKYLEDKATSAASKGLSPADGCGVAEVASASSAAGAASTSTLADGAATRTAVRAVAKNKASSQIPSPGSSASTFAELGSSDDESSDDGMDEFGFPRDRAGPLPAEPPRRRRRSPARARADRRPSLVDIDFGMPSGDAAVAVPVAVAPRAPEEAVKIRPGGRVSLRLQAEVIS
eukprot:TRINITY_DN50724_c0_g1_i1.p1 TRINITY_DN50724_c0_g1~~TRINITY_DN50724_c0_g1_i1.p1  ORF type:complete len:208 (+),score=37.77 TRINITY_DN50724_c0_g1_i1:59-625(+)